MSVVWRALGEGLVEFLPLLRGRIKEGVGCAASVLVATPSRPPPDAQGEKVRVVSCGAQGAREAKRTPCGGGHALGVASFGTAPLAPPRDEWVGGDFGCAAGGYFSAR